MDWTFPCELESNYDGDTFRLALDIGFGMKYYAPVRLHGVDTPELRGGTDATKALAAKARDEAEKLIRSSETVIFHSLVWRGKYGRPVGDIECDGIMLSNYLIDARLGVPYDGGSREEIQEYHAANAEFHGF